MILCRWRLKRALVRASQLEGVIKTQEAQLVEALHFSGKCVAVQSKLVGTLSRISSLNANQAAYGPGIAKEALQEIEELNG